MKKRSRPEPSDLFSKYLLRNSPLSSPDNSDLIDEYETIKEENQLMQKEINKYKQEINKLNTKVL